MQDCSEQKLKVLVLGNGGHCRSILDIIERYDSHFTVNKIIDDTRVMDEQSVKHFLSESNCVVLAIGQLEDYTPRMKAVDKFNSTDSLQDVWWPTLTAKTAVVSKSAKIKKGTVVMNNAVINAYAKVGEFCIINTASVIEHDAEVGYFTHISTGAVVNGGAKVGCMCFVGSNSVIFQGASICDNCIIGAGSVVTGSITEPGKYFGNPARKIVAGTICGNLMS